MPRRQPRVPLAAFGLLCFAAVAAGCGSDSDTKPAPESSTPAHGSYAQCLEEHGVTNAPKSPGSGDQPEGPLPGPPPSTGTPPAPPGVDQEVWDTANAACATLAPGPANGG